MKKSRISQCVVVVVCLAIVMYVGIGWIHFTTCKIHITYNGKEIKDVNVVKVKVSGDSEKPVKHTWLKRSHDKIKLFNWDKDATEYQYQHTEECSWKRGSEQVYQMNYYIADEIQCAAITWNADIVNENGIWKANYNVKYREPKWGAPIRRK
ncbi:MAG: hypothetical protein V8S14_01725 [Lachnospiraceae bacterium]